jgi:hypothetical protein
MDRLDNLTYPRQIAVVFLIIVLPLLIAHLALVVWAFYDAKRRGKSGVPAAL